MRVITTSVLMSSPLRRTPLTIPGAEVHYLTKSRTSWIVVKKGWLGSEEGAFEREWELKPSTKRKLKVFGRECQENRWSQSWGTDYPYSGQRAEAVPIPEGSFVADLEAKLNALGVPVNGCLQNWYAEDSTIGLHADDEGALVRGSPIFALSWGATRRFRLLPRDPAEKTMELNLSDGDLLIMGGDCQRTHRHDIPKYRKTKAPFPPGRRISWTFRVFKPAFLSDESDPTAEERPSKRRAL